MPTATPSTTGAANKPHQQPAGQPAAERRAARATRAACSGTRQRNAVLVRRAVDAEQRAGEQIVQRPAERARHLPPHRLRHVGADHLLLPQEFVARRDLPVRPGRIDGPVREIVGIDLQLADGCLQRPVLQKAPERAAEQIVVALRALRIVALDIEDMPPPDQSICAALVRGHRRLNEDRVATGRAACGAGFCRSRFAADRRPPRSGAAACSRGSACASRSRAAPAAAARSAPGAGTT